MARSLSSIRIVQTLMANLEAGVDVDENASVAQGINVTPATRFASGTGANQADRIWFDKERTITSGNSENIDMFDLGSLDIGMGAGKDALGQALALAEIVGFAIYVLPASAGKVIVGGEGSGAAWNSMFNGSDTAELGPIGPGGGFNIYTPGDPAFAVADSTNHLLKIAATGGNVTYTIGFLGRSA